MQIRFIVHLICFLNHQKMKTNKLKEIVNNKILFVLTDLRIHRTFAREITNISQDIFANIVYIVLDFITKLI